MFIDNTMSYILDIFDKNTYVVEQIIKMYSNCTIHPIHTNLIRILNFKSRAKINKYLRKLFLRNKNKKIGCPDISSDYLESLKIIQLKINRIILGTPSSGHVTNVQLNNLFIQEKICIDNIRFMSIQYPGSAVAIDCNFI